jgi:hypothetical protein
MFAGSSPCGAQFETRRRRTTAGPAISAGALMLILLSSGAGETVQLAITFCFAAPAVWPALVSSR